MSSPSDRITTSSVAVDTGNPALNSLIQRGLLIATTGITVWITAWLTSKGWYDPEFGWLITVAVFGFLSSLALVIWGYVRGSRLTAFIDEVQRTAVMAGINLTATGNAVTLNGNAIAAHTTSARIETPKPVTSITAKEIVANFADRRVSIAPLPNPPASA